MKKGTMISLPKIISLALSLLFVFGVGWIVLKDVSDIPFKLCENETGLIIDPEQDYVWYDCDKVNNVTVGLAMVT